MNNVFLACFIAVIFAKIVGSKMVAGVPVGGQVRIDLNELDPGFTNITELFHASIALWRSMPPTWIEHLRRAKAERDRAETSIEAAGDGRAA